MSVRIRLTKTGRKHQISYRIVAQDAHTKRDGKFLEILGFYNPKLKPPADISVKNERLQFWVSKGAKPTAGVTKLIEKFHGRAT